MRQAKDTHRVCKMIANVRLLTCKQRNQKETNIRIYGRYVNQLSHIDISIICMPW